MADLRDELGNPIQLTDQHGNPVQLKDEFGNPMKLSGVAITSGSGSALHSATAANMGTGIIAGSEHQESPSEQPDQVRSSSSSSSSSSEDDGQGGRRKKGLKEKIKEKFSGGKHKDKDDQLAHRTPSTATTGSGISTSTGGQHQEHEKKSLMEKIKERMPGHHEHH